ncbi:daptide-type RiPP biosynthesis aminotransferase [Sphaerimonospora mesophila]|uniref:daptide-type RiPP biosynthesis aminotransferase n=1 Tax=Sphaerimonospora mesophila TaxID=37483 RepID=UPI0006E2E079
MSDIGQPLWPYLLPFGMQGRDDLCIVSAHGHRVEMADGRTLLCGTSGLWNANLGYGNPAIAAAAAEAMRTVSYGHVFRYENVYARRAAAALVEECGADHFARVLFSTGGGAANDLAMKLVRHYQVSRGRPRRRLVVGLRGGFHGLTYGGFAITGEDLGQRLYGVDQRLIRHVTPNRPGELRELLSRQGEQVAAVVVEPVLGTGTLPLTEAYLEELFRLRQEYGFLLVADEVATGFGRTGTFFASQRWPQRPDLLLTSKGLTNGTMAAAAVVVSHDVAAAFTDGHSVFCHAETQGGTAVSCAAILATISEMHRLDAVSLGRELAERLDAELARLAAEEPLVAEVTGLGCFRSLHLRTPDGAALPPAEVPRLVAAIREAGAIVHPGPHGVQLIPALTYTEADLAELLDCVRRGLAAFASADSPEAAG